LRNCGPKLRDAAELIEAGVEETLSYYAFPSEHWRSLRTNNLLERSPGYIDHGVNKKSELVRFFFRQMQTAYYR
jgi:transposase-like protein